MHHNTHATCAHFQLLRNDGQSWRFETLEQMVDALLLHDSRWGWTQAIGLQWQQRKPTEIQCTGPNFWTRDRSIVFQNWTLIVRDHLGNVVDPAQLPWPRKLKRKQPSHQHTYRCDPVERTGIRGCASSARRSPRTKQEKTWNEDDEHKPWTRYKRHAHNLPSRWDMPWRKALRNWKHYRMTRWKE